MQLPTFALASTQFIRGANSLDDAGLPILKRLPMEQVFDGRFETDAHFLTYVVADESGPMWDVEHPRLNKPVLAALREQGMDILRHSFAIDWDTPAHKPWGQTISVPEFEERFLEAASRFPLMADFTVAYYTSKGWRAVYVLDKPIPVDESEPYLRWFIYSMASAGFKCDELVDWTRLLRAPRVLRTNKETQETYETENDKYFALEWSETCRLQTEKLNKSSRSDKVTVYAEIRHFNEPMPDIEEAKSLIETAGNGQMQPTQWTREAKKRLRNRECYPCLFEHKPLARSGARDTTIHQYVGQAVSMLHGMPGTTPDHIFGLFLDPISQLEQDQDWLGILWSAIGRLWVKEEAKEQAKREEELKQEQEREEKKDRLLLGMRAWCGHPALHGDDEEARLWATGRLVVSHANNYYLIDHDGKYRPQAYLAHQLIPAIRRNISDLIDTVRISENGNSSDVSLNAILNSHSTAVASVIYKPCIDSPFIENVDTPYARLVLPAYSRNEKLIPTYDEDVDAWMQELFGDHYEEACRWCAKALDFEGGPICALSLEAEQGSGKGMLVQGFAECLTVPCIATDKDLSDWGDNLIKSPFLNVNEGWNVGGRGKNPADRFREIVAGEIGLVNRKHLALVEVKNPMRVIFTANNLDVIRLLAKGDLTQTDRDALAIRLMHFELGDRASNWLRAKGGIGFTGRKGRRWIESVSGAKSDFILAKHLLWLYEQRDRWPNGKRFLVEGHGSQKLMFDMQTSTGSAPIVIETLLAMIDSKQRLEGIDVDFESGEVHVLTAAIVNYFRQQMSQYIRGENLTNSKVSKVLGGLCHDFGPKNTRLLPGKESLGRRRWFKLDLNKLAKVMELEGFRCSKMESLLISHRRKERHK